MENNGLATISDGAAKSADQATPVAYGDPNIAKAAKVFADTQRWIADQKSQKEAQQRRDKLEKTAEGRAVLAEEAKKARKKHNEKFMMADGSDVRDDQDTEEDFLERNRRYPATDKPSLLKLLDEDCYLDLNTLMGKIIAAANTAAAFGANPTTVATIKTQAQTFINQYPSVFGPTANQSAVDQNSLNGLNEAAKNALNAANSDTFIRFAANQYLASADGRAVVNGFFSQAQPLDGHYAGYSEGNAVQQGLIAAFNTSYVARKQEAAGAGVSLANLKDYIAKFFDLGHLLPDNFAVLTRPALATTSTTTLATTSTTTRATTSTTSTTRDTSTSTAATSTSTKPTSSTTRTTTSSTAAPTSSTTRTTTSSTTRPTSSTKDENPENAAKGKDKGEVIAVSFISSIFGLFGLALLLKGVKDRFFPQATARVEPDNGRDDTVLPLVDRGPTANTGNHPTHTTTGLVNALAAELETTNVLPFADRVPAAAASGQSHGLPDVVIDIPGGGDDIKTSPNTSTRPVEPTASAAAAASTTINAAFKPKLATVGETQKEDGSLNAAPSASAKGRGGKNNPRGQVADYDRNGHRVFADAKPLQDESKTDKHKR